MTTAVILTTASDDGDDDGGDDADEQRRRRLFTRPWYSTAPWFIPERLHIGVNFTTCNAQILTIDWVILKFRIRIRYCLCLNARPHYCECAVLVTKNSPPSQVHGILTGIITCACGMVDCPCSIMPEFNDWHYTWLPIQSGDDVINETI